MHLVFLKNIDTSKNTCVTTPHVYRASSLPASCRRAELISRTKRAIAVCPAPLLVGYVHGGSQCKRKKGSNGGLGAWLAI